MDLPCMQTSSANQATHANRAYESDCGCMNSSRLKVVRVVRPDGKYEQFAEPMEVSELMCMYPGYLVMLCSSMERQVGTLSKVMIMRPGQELTAGQSYLLHPIPSHHLKSTIFRTPSISKSLVVPLGPESGGPGLDQALTTRRPMKLKKLSTKKTKRLEDFKELCVNFLQPLQPAAGGVSPRAGEPSSSSISSSNIGDYSPSITAYASARRVMLGNRICEAPHSPLLDSRTGNSNSLDSSDDTPRPSLSVSWWKPALDSIPESPLSVQSFGGDHDLQSRNPTGYHLLVDDR
ncbi:hypothetical protein R1sor_020326 [Riccia sorocarpa]|uniref:Uncharacterized protein n=1 Tax=Riccia sorocarpa TaxID=122646 RepID=A0ABD3ILB6_9MARC